jgi:ATP-dependent RNA helicase DDX10/DBP4
LRFYLVRLQQDVGRGLPQTLEIIVACLQARLQAEAPARGTNPLSLGPDAEGYAAAREFHQLPLSKLTLEGLAAHNFKTLTAIQRAALPHALAGRDVLGAAKTGSGKTLCFIIPVNTVFMQARLQQKQVAGVLRASGTAVLPGQVVEKLFRARWTRLDGLGALILTPTRELALQIFQELRKVCVTVPVHSRCPHLSRASAVQVNC